MSRKLADFKKIIIFGIIAAFGCLMGAVVGESVLAFLLPTPSFQQVDVLFILDVTSSMNEEISGVQKGITNFVSTLNSKELDTQVGLIAYGDRFEGEESLILSFEGKPFTKDTNSFKRQVAKIEMFPGGDAEESTLDAIVLGSQQPFREEAHKVLVVITDAPPKIPDRETTSLNVVEQSLINQNIDQIHLVINDEYRFTYKRLQNDIPGEIFSLAETAEARQNFESILPQISEKIGSAIGTQGVQKEEFRALIIAISAWTALLALGTFIALMIGQNRYLRTSIAIPEGIAGTLGSLTAGAIAGVIGQLFYGEMANTFFLTEILHQYINT